MKVSRGKALDLLSKLKNMTISVVLEEGPPESPTSQFVVTFRGVVSEELFSDESITIISMDQRSKFSIYLPDENGKFEYQDFREVPPEYKEIASATLAGLVMISTESWRCTFFESKD
jgi:hypothetical protein